MKKQSILLLAIVPLLLSCGQAPAAHSSSMEESSTSTFVPVSSFTKEEPSKDGVYDFYCVNDYHGAILEQDAHHYGSTFYEAGIAKYFGKLKALKEADPDHTVILSAGDMFQGSLESNSNYGKLVTEAMNATGFDAMCLGNHEFDYGQERLLENINRASFPILGGNIVKRNTQTPWNGAIKKSTVIERGGNKIGIVGMIGYGQTTSICSKYVKDIDFLTPTLSAKLEALRLRQEEGCDLVIYLLHDDMTTCYSQMGDKSIFDGVFNGHTHSINDEVVNGVPFVQSYSNGEAISHFQITIKDGVSTCTDHGLIFCDKNWTEDKTIADIRDSYIEEPAFKEKANAVAGTITGTLAYDEGVPNIAVKAMYEKYKALHPELVCAIENSQRADLTGTVTYSDIYKATPFMNKIVIAKVLGSEIEYEAKYASCYRGDNGAFESKKYYTIACIDYVLLHQNESKRYNYFNSLNTDFDTKIIAEYEDFPVDITFDYIKNTLGGSVNASDFKTTRSGFGPY